MSISLDDDGPKEYIASTVVLQDSPLGPLPRNIMYNDVIIFPIPEEVTVLGYADDIALVTIHEECCTRKYGVEVAVYL